MAQGALGAAGVRRAWYGLEVGRSVGRAGGAGAYCVATRTAYYYSEISGLGGGMRCAECHSRCQLLHYFPAVANNYMMNCVSVYVYT